VLLPGGIQAGEGGDATGGGAAEGDPCWERGSCHGGGMC
jgi:hypothetical protein